jgi:hypothetical protein
MSNANGNVMADDGPELIGPDYAPKRTFPEKLTALKKAFTTK